MNIIIATIRIVIFCTLLLLYLSQSIQSNNYLAIAAAAVSSENTVSIMAVGDSIGYNIKHEKLSNLSNIIHNDTDIFIFKLEGSLMNSSFLDNGDSIEECKGFPSHQSTFVTESTFVDYLKLAPITIANLANNHIFDCGIEGIKETKKILDEKDILSVGAGLNLKEACEPLFIQSNEGLRIVFVSYNFVLDDLVSAQSNHAGGGAASLDGCNHDYNKIRMQKQADLIIASIHLGRWSSNVSDEQIDVVRYLFDSGVDIVIGHSPHMPQAIATIITTTAEEVEERGGEEKLAFFSLGNFILRPNYAMPSQAHTTIVPKLEINTESNIISL